MSDAASITSMALSNVQAPIGISMLKKAMNIQASETLQLIQSATQSSQALQTRGIGRHVNSIA